MGIEHSFIITHSEWNDQFTNSELKPNFSSLSLVVPEREIQQRKQFRQTVIELSECGMSSMNETAIKARKISEVSNLSANASLNE